MAYDAVLFGEDGVLTHRTPIETRRAAVVGAFRSLGATPDDGSVDAVLRGGPGQVRAVCRRHDVDPDAFWEKRESCAAATQRTAMLDGRKPLYADVSAALDGCRRTVGVVAAAPAATVRHLLDVFDLRDRVRVALGREPTLEGYARRTPDTSYVEVALEELGTRNVLVVANRNADLVAAERVGVDTAFVRRPDRPGERMTADPTYELNSLREVPALA